MFGESERVSKDRRTHAFLMGSNDSFDEELVDGLAEGPEVAKSSLGLRQLKVFLMPPKFLGVAAGFSFCTHVDNISSTGRYQQKRNLCEVAQGLVVVAGKLLHKLRAKVGLFLTTYDPRRVICGPRAKRARGLV